MNAIPPPLPANVQPPFPVAKKKGSGFAASSIVIAVVGLPMFVIFFINLFLINGNPYERSNSIIHGLSGFGLLMCIFGLGFHFIGIALAITATVLGSKATGIIGIGLNVGVLLLIIVATLFAVAS